MPTRVGGRAHNIDQQLNPVRPLGRWCNAHYPFALERSALLCESRSAARTSYLMASRSWLSLGPLTNRICRILTTSQLKTRPVSRALALLLGARDITLWPGYVRIVTVLRSATPVQTLGLERVGIAAPLRRSIRRDTRRARPPHFTAIYRSGATRIDEQFLYRRRLAVAPMLSP
jgi:hypothetical protein